MTDPLGPEPRTAIRVTGLTVSFAARDREIVALSDVSLDIREREFLCIVGHSGCGKTTLLNVLAGYIAPTRGRLTIDDRPIVGPGPDRAVVFQSDAVFPWMSVADNIAFAPSVAGTSRAETRRIVDRYLDLVGLNEFRGAWPKELSGGMRKRVDLARAYAADPRVMLLDEPFNALDVETKERLQDELGRLWLAEPRTTVFVTHDLEEALYLGTRVVVMSPRPGRIAAIHGVPFSRPRDPGIRLTPEFVAMRALLREQLRGQLDTSEEAA